MKIIHYFLQERKGAAYLLHITNHAKDALLSSVDFCHLCLVSNAYLML